MSRNICQFCKGSGKCPDCGGVGYLEPKVPPLGVPPWPGHWEDQLREQCPTCGDASGCCPRCGGKGFLDNPAQETIREIHAQFEQYVDKGEYEEAKILVEESLKKHGKKTLLLYDLGQLLAIIGRKQEQSGNKEEASLNYKNAITIFEEILEIEPAYKEAYLNIWVILHLDMNRYEEAVKVAQKGLKRFPKYYELSVSLCMSLNKLGQWEEVLQIATAQLEKIKNDANPKLDRKIVDQHGKAKGTFREKYEGGFLVCMGDASFEKSEISKAMEFYQQAMRIPYWNTEFILEKINKCKERITKRCT